MGDTLQFYSLAFAVFLAVTLAVYWTLRRWGFRRQNLFLLIAGCVFCGWFDYRFLALLVLSPLVDYLVGLRLATVDRTGARRFLLALSLAADLGTLAFFKYLNFFLPLFAEVFRNAGLREDAGALGIVVPLGISFFTLQRLSYTIEIYHRRLAPTRDLISFTAFSCFFPLLVSGPIEKATQLLPQFLKARSFDIEKLKDALRLILWGLFKKIVIADTLAARVDFVFANYDCLAGIDLALGAFLYAVQLYADFSGYSDIALGISRLFGFRVTRNFSYPYFSRDMAEFWRRWHVSLSFWFRDYIFTPLTMNVNIRAHARRMACVLVTFTASGLWHRASWTFIVWGFLNGLGFVPLIFGKAPAPGTRQVAEGRLLPSVREWLQMKILFLYVLLGWIFFRSSSLTDAGRFIIRMLTQTWLVMPGGIWLLVTAAAFLILEWFRRARDHPLDVAGMPAGLQAVIYAALLGLIYYFGHFSRLDFIYSHF